MGYYTKPIANALKNNDLAGARKWLPYIVRRDPNTLSESQIISAAVESIAESTTDGITAPFFFLRHLWRARRLRLQSHQHVGLHGWLQKRGKQKHRLVQRKPGHYTNYIPARLTAYLMVASAALLGENWREGWRILQRDKGKTTSVNAGWTISAMAGALDTQLEKQGCYTLGDDNGITPEHINRALKVMTVTAALFGLVVVLPILALRILIVW